MRKYRNEGWLREKYWDEKLSLQEMGELAEVSASTIGRWMEKNDIDRRKKNHANTLEKPMPEGFIELLEGELLGDGSIAQNGIFWYGTSRAGYRDWLADRFRAVGFTVRESDTDAHRFRTLTYQCLQEMQDRWYPGGEKRIPDDLELTPVVMRQWFIGDGNAARSGSQIRIKANGRSNEELNLLKSKMGELGVQVTVQQNKSIYVHAASRDKFYEYMADLPDKLKSVYGYKWP